MRRRAILDALRRPAAPPLLVSALLIATGGFVHMREWLDVYRDVPASVPGAAVVRIGFPVNAAVSVGLAVALVAVAVVITGRWVATMVVAAAAAFEAVSLAVLIRTRTGSFLGWMESGWGRGASEARAFEVGALVALALAAAVAIGSRSGPSKHPSVAGGRKGQACHGNRGTGGGTCG